MLMMAVIQSARDLSLERAVMTCFSFCRRGKEASSNARTVEIDEEVSSVQNVRLFTYKDLRVATANFSADNKVGEGGFGRVFKGTLVDGTLVAVKVLAEQSRQGVREFLTEINSIAEIQHDNLVELHGCCIEGKHRILVYGYLQNNSLAQTLLGGGHSSIHFSWQIRREICIGVAKGLAFLNEEAHIVHRDIKASNILLDDHLKPKISDFGLAKLFDPSKTHISTRVAGTTGYLAPEYALRGHMNRKVDVYSFGVLLMEIVSGRCNTNRRLPPEERYLLQMAWRLHEGGDLLELVDVSLNGDFNKEEALCFLKISLLCTQDVPKLRPSMPTVVQMLTGKIDVNEEKVTKPGILSESKIKIDLGDPHVGSSYTLSTVGDKASADRSSSSGDVTASYATMTFNSIYDRTS